MSDPLSDEIVQRFLYYPDRIPEDMPPPAWAGGASEVWMKTEDGVRIHGLWWDEPARRPVFLFLHGNAQEVYSWSLVREELASAECRMLLIDYHGYGKSGGRPGEEESYADGRAALRWLEQEGVREQEIIPFGKSLGGAVACEIARNRSLKGMILESTFTSLASVARELFPFTPGGFMPDPATYDSISKLPEIRCPLLLIHGEQDALIPVKEGIALYDAAREPKELLLVKGAGHNDVSMVAGEDYGARIRDWLEGLPAPG